MIFIYKQKHYKVKWAALVSRWLLYFPHLLIGYSLSTLIVLLMYAGYCLGTIWENIKEWYSKPIHAYGKWVDKLDKSLPKCLEVIYDCC